MKNIGLILIMLIAFYSAKAQSEKGTFQLGIGGLPIIYPGNSTGTGYSLRANIGYFPINRLSVGVIPFAGKVRDMKSIGTSVYLRYYIISKRVTLFVEAGGGFGNLKYDNSPQYNGTMNSFNLGPGLHYTFKSKHKNKFAIEFLIQYARLQNINYPESTTTGNTLIPTLGIQYFINNKNHNCQQWRAAIAAQARWGGADTQTKATAASRAVERS